MHLCGPTKYTNTHTRTHVFSGFCCRFLLRRLYDLCHLIWANYTLIVIAIKKSKKRKMIDIMFNRRVSPNTLTLFSTLFTIHTRDAGISVRNLRSVHNILPSRTHAHTHVQFATIATSCRAQRKFTIKADQVTRVCISECV